ncbi:MAG: hypothetical protein JXP34_07075 [Planctomycetes bacterium]|nr:hypothetical protein [Planctomycetota bacterium]
MRNRLHVLIPLVLCIAGAGCATQGEGPVRYPAHGFTSIRPYGVFMRNMGGDRAVERGGTLGNPGTDNKTGDIWENGFGGGVEVTADANPFLGVQAGIGYEYFGADDLTGPTGDVFEVDDMHLMPFYVGGTARLPFWVNWAKWSEDQDRQTLPDSPIGPALYVKGNVGGAWLFNPVDVYSSAILEKHKGLDRQIFPLFEALAGIEMRIKGIGLFAEGGYRYMIITNTSNLDGFSPQEMTGPMVRAGIAIYTW